MNPRVPKGARGGYISGILKFSKGPPGNKMKAGIHPAYNEINVTCACAHTFKTRSTHKGDMRVEICSACHPFFTGRQKLMDTAGRIDRFEKKYAVSRGAKVGLFITKGYRAVQEVQAQARDTNLFDYFYAK